MAEKLMLEVVTPQKGHTTFLTSLKVGTLKYTDVSGKEKLLFVNGGFAEVLPDKVTILAESAERQQDIDVVRAQAAKERAEQRLANRAAGIDLLRAELALRRALHRLKVAQYAK
jgi:F-type H+-transporting ATPase subunit epsilon